MDDLKTLAVLLRKCAKNVQDVLLFNPISFNLCLF